MTAPATAKTLDAAALHRLFDQAHTTHTFTDEPVSPDLIAEAYQHMRWAPTAFNSQPLRLTLLTPGAKREEVVEHFIEANRAKTLAAPLTIIAAYAPDWHEHMELLAPQREGARESFAAKPQMRETVGRQSGSIQVGYLLLGLRAVGLEVGPMTGLNPEGVDSVIHTENGWKTLVAINVGHAPNPEDEAAIRPRGGRLEFSQAAQVL
ncbi:malonic semialdehyde reductase [Nesterenkonia sp.]|uniref:malonic semialdehyde reductase n=1 Tax=Nesterenkonia sp. TaxID=704201 RepID=UPI00262AB147|nr:malonic semialdehyde reductase [Nesterenkonia sp.]